MWHLIRTQRAAAYCQPKARYVPFLYIGFGRTTTIQSGFCSVRLSYFGLLKKDIAGLKFRSDEELGKWVIAWLRQVGPAVWRQAIFDLPSGWTECAKRHSQYVENKVLVESFQIKKKKLFENIHK